MTKNPNQTNLYAEGTGIAQAVNGAIATVVTNVFQGDARDRYVQRYRQKILERVKNIWIEGVLQRSLQNTEIIELELEDVSQLVECSLNEGSRISDILSGSHQFIEVFERADRALLVLGDPGSGKTTTLLSLARILLIQAQTDLLHPVPIVLNLSSWSGNKRKSFEEWLLRNLQSIYGIPPKITQLWVDNDDLVLLLDGLDEMPQADQEVFVRAFNKFRQGHNLIPVLICGRVIDYKNLATRLKLQGSVFLRSLTPQQINAYLSRSDAKYSAIRWLLQHNENLRDLSRSPLMLNIILRTYQGMTLKEIVMDQAEEIHLNTIFATYVEHMYKSKDMAHPYSFDLVKRWLAWLAFYMSQDGKKEFESFNLEKIKEPTWSSISQVFRSALAMLWLLVWIGLTFSFVSLPLGLWVISLMEPAELLAIDKISYIWEFIATLILNLFDALRVSKPLLNAGLLIVWGVFVTCVVTIISGVFYLPMMYFGFPQRVFYSADPIYVYLLGYMPWNYRKFLEYAVRINLLYKTKSSKDIFGHNMGNSYMFMHQLLQDYFASLWEEK